MLVQDTTVRWSIKVSPETDLALRSLLGSQGGKKGDLSRFVEQAVIAAVFHRTVADIQARNCDVDPELVQSEIDVAAHEVRALGGSAPGMRSREA